MEMTASVPSELAPLDAIRLKVIFEHHVAALRAFECAHIPEYSVERIRGAHHRIFALRAIGPSHDAPSLED
jgi:hypothetical protein